MAPIKKEYDYVVIGGGSGGMAAARRAASYGAKVAIIEAHSVLGGTCVNVGCVPKKIMWNTASVNEMLKQAAGYGYSVSEYKFDWNTVKTKRDAYIKRLNGIYENNMQREKVDHFHGHAGFKDAKTVVVTAEGAEPIELSGKKILIATGSHSIIPNVPGKELGIDSDGFFQLEHQPKRVAVVGTGYIAVELAGVFHALGSEVTVFSRTKFILRKFDDIIRNNLLTEMQNVGVNFVFDSGVKGLRLKDENDKSGPIIVEYESNGEKGELEADTVLWAIGRVPRTEGLNLEAAGVQVDQRGHIVVDEYQNTNVENIYSLGDVIGKAELTPVAVAAGRKLSNRLFGGEQYKDDKLDYENIPTVVFSHPTVGTCGLTEPQAKEKYGDIKVYQAKFVNMYFGLLDHKEPTAYKIICAGPDEKVVGLHLLGRGSDEILQGFGVAMRMGATKRDFDNCVAIHPTAAEELVTMR